MTRMYACHDTAFVVMCTTISRADVTFFFFFAVASMKLHPNSFQPGRGERCIGEVAVFASDVLSSVEAA
jgi:hypothetical protein